MADQGDEPVCPTCRKTDAFCECEERANWGLPIDPSDVAFGDAEDDSW